MLDAFYAIEKQIHPPVLDTAYTSDQAIVSVDFVHVPNSDTMTIVFPPWHAPEWFTRHLKQQLVGQHSNALIYAFNPMILSQNVMSVKNSFEFIALSIAEDFKKLHAQKHFRVVNLLGLSIGSVALCITAEKLPHIDSITLVVPGNDLASSMWDGWRTRRLRNTIKTEGYKLAELQNEWDDLAPQAHIETLKSHPVHIVLAKQDHFIPYQYGRELFDALHMLNPMTTCHISPFGHIATILRYTLEG
ncbi:MAG: hypothetical protein ACHQT5_01460 [Candidatus Saccharimonadales bacterium]|jgi:hypothetical protein